METRAPSCAARWAKARPMPLDPPVMNTCRFLIGILTGFGRTMRCRIRRRERGKRRSNNRERKARAIPVMEIGEKVIEMHDGDAFQV